MLPWVAAECPLLGVQRTFVDFEPQPFVR